MLARMQTNPRLTPLLVVRDAARAVTFYREAFGATELVRYTNPINSTISHAELSIGDALIAITEEARAWNSDAPPSLGGSPVVLQLRVEHVDTSFEHATRAGATVVFAVQEFCGERMGRLRDPFGHLWILTQRLEDLTFEEIRRRRDELFATLAGG
jgi:PhnB protein